jgi:hypothetical protein
VASLPNGGRPCIRDGRGGERPRRCLVLRPILRLRGKESQCLRMKVSGKKKTEPLKIVVPRAKSSTKRPSDAEIALAKPVKRTKIALGSLTAPAVMRVGAVMSGAKGLAARCEKGRCSHSRPPDTSGTHVSRGFISGVAGIVASQPTPESCFETGHRCFVAACYCCRHQWGFRFASC